MQVDVTWHSFMATKSQRCFGMCALTDCIESTLTYATVRAYESPPSQVTQSMVW